MKPRTSYVCFALHAKVAGSMFLFSMLVPLLYWGFILSPFVDPESAMVTAENILAEGWLFRVGILMEIVTALILVTLSLSLFSILRSISEGIARFGFILILADAMFTLVIALGHLAAWHALDNLDLVSPLIQQQVKVLVGLLLSIHLPLTSLPGMLLGFGMSCYFYLFLKSTFIPSVVAGFGLLSYFLICLFDLLLLLSPEVSADLMVQIIVWGPNVLFTGFFGFWLIIKKVNAQ